MNHPMNEKLTGVPETLLIPLWARAVETGKPAPIVQDEKAVEMVSRIDYDFSRFENSLLSQVGVSVRTMLLDAAVRAFCEKNPGAMIVNLGAGLDTRYQRLALKDIRWYELDLPESIGLRRCFFTEDERYRFIERSFLDLSWMDEIEGEKRPLLCIAEGLFMYFTEAQIRGFVAAFADRFPDSEMLFEMLAPFLVGRGKHHETVKKIDSAVDFTWGLKDSREMTTWRPGIEFIEEWNYFDYYKERWKWFGVLARMPFFRPRLANRIVHLRFTNRT